MLGDINTRWWCSARPVGSRPIGDPQLTRRGFLGAGLSVPIAHQALAFSTNYHEVELRFDWNKNRSKVVVTILRASSDENGKPVSAGIKVGESWEIDRRSFGPNATLALKRTVKSNGLLRYELRVLDASFGRLAGRDLTFLFDQQETNSGGPASDKFRRFGLVVRNSLFSHKSPSHSATFYLEAYPAMGFAKVGVSDAAAEPVALAAFMQGAVKLHQRVSAWRVKNTMALMFNGQLRQDSKDNFRPVWVRFDHEASWTFSQTHHLAERRSKTPPDPVFYALHRSMKLSSIRVFWAQEDAQSIGLSKKSLALRAEATIDPRVLQNQRGSSEFAFAPTKGPTVTLGYAPSTPNENEVIFLKTTPTETGSNGNRRDEVVSEAVLTGGNWTLRTSSGSNRSDFGRLESLEGRLHERVSAPAAIDSANYAQSKGSLSFEARFTTSTPQMVSSPSGQLVLRGPTLGEDDENAPGATPSGNANADDNVQDPFAPRRPAPLHVAWSWASGNWSKPKLEWLELNSILIEADPGLEGASFSRLTFKPTEIVIFHAPNGLKHPARASAISLSDNEDVPVARLDLSRARLKAARSDDLLSLHFEFSDLWLVLGDGPPEIVARNDACFLQSRPDANGRNQPDDSRPVLVVEFPGQHLFEESLFLPKLPDLPDRTIIGENLEPTSQLCLYKESGKAVTEDCPDGLTNLPAEVDGILVFDPNDREQVIEILRQLPDAGTRRTARLWLQKKKIEHQEILNKQPAAVKKLDPDGFEKLAADFERNVQSLVRRNLLPRDQTIYIGGYGLDPDAMHVARRDFRAILEGKIVDFIANTFAEVEKSRTHLEKQFGGPVKSDLSIALELEAQLESAVPSYQLFRNFYREAMMAAFHGSMTGAGHESGGTKTDIPTELSAANLEYVHGAGAWGNTPWMTAAGVTAAVLANRAAQIRKRYLTYISKTDPQSVIDRDTEKGLLEGRLANPSRLAFKVSCRDAIEAARLDVVPLDHSPDARETLPRDRLEFSLDSLTNFAGFEMSVVRRAEIVYSPDETGSIDKRSRRRVNLNPGAMLDHLGFSQGLYVTSSTRLADVQNSLIDPPDRLQTAIEIPARLILSPHQDAVVLTPGKIPRLLYDGEDDGEETPKALWSAKFLTDTMDPGIRAVHSPDLRSDFVWQRQHRNSTKQFIDNNENPPKEHTFRQPGGAAPPRGPLAPWFIGPERTSAPSGSPRGLADSQFSQDPEVRAALNRGTTNVEFCREVESASQTPSNRLALPLIIEAMCRPFLKPPNGSGDARMFRGPTDAYMRHELVLLSSGWGLPVVGRRDAQGQLARLSSQVEPERRNQLVDVLPGSALYQPRSLRVSELSLSALGGSLRHDTTFEPPAAAKHYLDKSPLFDALSIERWQQWTVLGRDIFCEVVFKGFLFPLGHRASLVQVTERSFLSDGGSIRAYLRQRMFIRVGKPEKQFPAIAQPNGGRHFPVEMLRFLTLQTPDIVDPNAIEATVGKINANGRFGLDKAPGLAFWPRTAPIPETNVRFEIEVDGHKSDLPLMFIDNVVANDEQSMKSIVSYYNNELPHPDVSSSVEPFQPKKHLRTIRFGGLKRRYAAELEAGSASLETDHWNLIATGREKVVPSMQALAGQASQVEQLHLQNSNFDFGPVLQGADQPPFYPALQTARVHLRQGERLTGRSLGPVRARMDGRYLMDGFPDRKVSENGSRPVLADNASELFLSFLDQPALGMGSKGDQAGGVFRPSGFMVAASRSRGLLSQDIELPKGASEDFSSYAKLFDYVPQDPSARPSSPAGGTLPALGSNPPAAGASSGTGAADALKKVQEIYSKLFDNDAKILGLVKIKDLFALIDQLEDPKTGMPEMAEQLRFGARELQNVADDVQGGIQDAVGDTTEFVRQQVLVPMSGATRDIREGWDNLERELLEQQKKELGATALKGQMSPITIAEVFPELDGGLRALDSALAKSAAITDPIAFALSLGEVYEAGRRFLDAIKRTATNPVERFEAAFKSRFLVAQGLFNSTIKGVSDALESLQKRFLENVEDILVGKLSELLVPGNEGDKWHFPPVRLPGFDILVNAADYATIGEAALLDDNSKTLMVKAQQDLREALYLDHSEMKSVVRSLMRHMFEGGEIDEFLADNSQNVFQTLGGIISFKSHAEQIADRLVDRASDAERIVQRLNNQLNKGLARLTNAAVKELEAYVAQLEQKGEALLRLMASEFADEILFVSAIYDAATAVVQSVEGRLIGEVAQALIHFVELLVGPIGLTAEAFCKSLQTSIEPLRRTIKALDIEALALCNALGTTAPCALENGLVPQEFKPLLEPGGAVDTVSLCGKIFSLHRQVTGAVDALNKVNLRKLLRDARAEVPKDNQKDYDRLSTKLRGAKADTHRLLDKVNLALAETYSDFVNDARAIAALNGAINAIHVVDVCTVDLEMLQQKLGHVPRDLKAFAHHREVLVKRMASRSRRLADELKAFASNETVWSIAGAAGLVKAFDAFIGFDAAKKKAELLKAELVKLEQKEHQLAGGIARLLSDVLGIMRKITSAASNAALWVKGQAQGSLGEIIDFPGLEKNVDRLVELDQSVAQANQKLTGFAAGQSPNAPSFNGLAELKTNIGIPVLEFEQIGVELNVEFQQRVLTELVKVEELVRDQLRQTRKEVLEALDELAIKVLKTELLLLPPSTVGGAWKGHNLASIYENALFKQRTEILNSVKESSIEGQLRRVFLVPVDGTRGAITGTYEPANEGDTLEETTDRLAGDVQWLKRATTQKPLSDKENRLFLAKFFQEWGADNPTPRVIFEQLAELVVHIMRGDLLKAIDFAAIREAFEDYLLSLVPTEIQMRYGYGVELGDKVADVTGGIFAPKPGTRLDVNMSIVLKMNPRNPSVSFRSVGKIGAFDIKLVGNAFDALTLKFSGAEFITEAGQKPKFNIVYDDFEIGEQLEFVQQLQSILSPSEGSGPFIRPRFDLPGVEAGYTLSLGMFSIGAVSFFNIGLRTSAVLPFSNRPARFKAGLSSRSNPFTISYLPYGGSGFFSIEADADGIVGFEASFEFGGAAAFGFGPMTGQARLMAGVYIRQFTLNDGKKITEINGTFFMGGTASIWIFSFGASLYVRLGMSTEGGMSGEAVFTYSFSIGIKDFDFSVTVFKKEGKGFSGGKQAALNEGSYRVAGLGIVGRQDDQTPASKPHVTTDAKCQCDHWSKYQSYFAAPKNPERFF